MDHWDLVSRLTVDVSSVEGETRLPGRVEAWQVAPVEVGGVDKCDASTCAVVGARSRRPRRTPTQRTDLTLLGLARVATSFETTRDTQTL